MQRKSIGGHESSSIENASQGFLVGLINRVLFRNSGALINRLLRGHNNPRLLATKANNRRPAPLSLDTLLPAAAVPALGSAPSLLSGFNSFLDHRPPDVDGPDVVGPEQTAEEFDAMLQSTPASVVPEVLMERREEYNEYLGRLESMRKGVVRRLNDVNERIARAVAERRDIESRMAALEGGGSGSGSGKRATVEDADAADEACEQDDVPRLRRLVHACAGHYGGVTALAHCGASGLVASGSLDTQVRVWDADAGHCKYVIGGHGDAVRGVQFYERFLLTAANDSRIRMWDLALLDSVQPRDARASHDTTPPVTPTICRRVAPLDLCCEASFTGHRDAVTCFQAAAGSLVSGSADGTVREWDLATGQLRHVIDLTWAARDPARSVRPRAPPLQPRGTAAGDAGFVGALQFYEYALATGTADGALRLWDLRTGQPHRQLFGHSMAVTALQFDDQTVVTGSLDGTALLWDLRTGRVLQTLEFEGPVTSVQLNSRRGASYDAACWIAASDHRMTHYRANAMQRVAYASDYGLLNHSMMRRQEDDLLLGAGGARVSRIYCQDEDTLISGDSEGIVKLWRV
ncbi:Mitochondrial fission protein [Coemansia sp. RSA 2050]|nr:Mitochondrial fission protein [Coemansia sp. RSA 2050]KAJ2734797.1 Mitochondrial fission protein [Coemansia sp. BCRC 34962]